MQCLLLLLFRHRPYVNFEQFAVFPVVALLVGAQVLAIGQRRVVLVIVVPQMLHRAQHLGACHARNHDPRVIGRQKFVDRRFEVLQAQMPHLHLI